MRQLSLFFGSDIYAASITLGTFMAGLSLGSYISGSLGDNVKKPILIYGILEIFIALCALLFPLIIFGMDETFRFIYQNYFFDHFFIRIQKNQSSQKNRLENFYELKKNEVQKKRL